MFFSRLILDTIIGCGTQKGFNNLMPLAFIIKYIEIARPYSLKLFCRY
jgi:hypothetical protein